MNDPKISLVHGPPLSSEPGLGPLTLPGYLREVTERYADREALVLRTPDGDVRWTYADVWERAVEVASSLRALGIGKDARVGVLMTNRPEWISATFGIALAGGVAVELSTFSTAPELEFMLQESATAVLLFERSVLKKDFATTITELTAGQEAKFPYLRHLAMVGEPLAGSAIETWDEFLARGVGQPRELVEATGTLTNPSDTAALFFSSGSTSKPKGIFNSHRGIAIQMWRFARLYGVTPDDQIRCWSANGFFWSGNFGMALGCTLSTGGSLVLQTTFDAAEALSLMQDERVNLPIAWPHQWAQLVAAPNWNDVDLSGMTFVDHTMALAGHPTIGSTWVEPGHAYGNTETFTLSTGYPNSASAEEIAGSSGVPLSGVTVKIIDPLTGAIVPRGERGEICIKGPTLMLGYLGKPLDETLDADGFFVTGDGGYLDDIGRLYWEGRLTDIIKTGGANVSPREVDEALHAYPGVKVAQTVGVPHETLGELVVSCIVPHEGVTLDAEAIRSHLRELLASYKVPRAVLFFDENDVALTGTAKIKTSDLKELAIKRLAE